MKTAIKKFLQGKNFINAEGLKTILRKHLRQQDLVRYAKAKAALKAFLKKQEIIKIDEIKGYVQELSQRKDLIKYLVQSDLKSQHKNSYLGFFWWLLDPLLQIFIYYFVVVVVFQRAKGAEYGIYLAIGLMTWRWLSSSITTAVRSITSQAGIITQVYLPKVTFPLCRVLSQMINFGFGLIVIAICLAFFKIKPGMAAIWLPYVISVQFLFLLAISTLIAYLSVFVRDMEMIAGHLMRIWFYFSPVIWYADRLPKKVMWLVELNPMACFLTSYRNIFIDNATPMYFTLFFIGCISIFLILAVLNIYNRNEHKIIKAL